MERFWVEANSVIKEYLTDNFSSLFRPECQEGEIDFLLEENTEQIVDQLKKIYYSKYGDDGK